MLASMRHEPWYVTGTVGDEATGAYAGWVAHPNSFASRASGTGAEGVVGVAFAGECFADDPTVGTAPGPWLLGAFETHGPAFVASLNGIFSGLLIDPRRRVAHLFNDRYGLERIYYHETPDSLFFASEAKALLRVVPPLRAFDDEGVAQFLGYGCTFGDRTLFRGVALAGGGVNWSLCAAAGVRKGRYFSPRQWETLPGLTDRQFDEEFLALAPRVFPKYARHCSRLGVSLTGGFDSRIVMACLPSEARPECYTYVGLTGETLDAQIARRVATSLGLPHRALRIGNDFLQHFGEHLDRSVYISDGTCGALGAHEIYYSTLVRQFAPVRLTGNFGGEILRSISTFKPLGLSRQLLASDAAAVVASVLPENGDCLHPVSVAAFLEIPCGLFGTLATGRSQVMFRTPYLDNELVALAFQAPASARTSPLPALRFLERIHPALAAIPTDRGQVGTTRGLNWLARRSFAEVTFKLDYWHKEGLPKNLTPLEPLFGVLASLGLLGLHKFLPYRRWFARELAPYVQIVCTDSQTRHMPWLNAGSLNQLAASHATGKANCVREINAVLTLEAVDRLLLRAA